MRRKSTSFISSIALYLINAVLSAVLGVAINKVFALYIDPTEYVVYSIFVNLFTLSVSVVFMVLTNSLLRFYSDYKNNNLLPVLYASTIKSLIIIGSVFFILFIILFPYISSSIEDKLYSSLLLLFGILFIPDGIKRISVVFARCQGKVRKQTYANIVEHLVKLLVFFISFFLIKKSVNSILYGSIVAVIVSGLMFIDCWQIPKNLLSINTKETSRKLLRFGLPLIGVPIVNYLLSASDQLIIMNVCGEYDAGLYSMGYKISSSLFSLLTSFLITASHHKIMEKYDKGQKSETEEFVGKLALLYWIICTPFLIDMVAFPKYVLQILASSQYINSSFVLSVSSLGIIFCGYINYTNKAWEISKKSWIIALFSGIGAIINITLNFIFVPRYGYNAAAVTTIISYLIVIIISGCCGKQYLSIKVGIQSIIKLCIIAVITATAVYFLNSFFVSNIFTFIIFAFASLIIYLLLLVILMKKEISEIMKCFKSIEV